MKFDLYLKDNKREELERLKEKDQENEKLKEELANIKKVSQKTHSLLSGNPKENLIN